MAIDFEKTKQKQNKTIQKIRTSDFVKTLKTVIVVLVSNFELIRKKKNGGEYFSLASSCIRKFKVIKCLALQHTEISR